MFHSTDATTTAVRRGGRAPCADAETADADSGASAPWPMSTPWPVDAADAAVAAGAAHGRRVFAVSGWPTAAAATASDLPAALTWPRPAAPGAPAAPASPSAVAADARPRPATDPGLPPPITAVAGDAAPPPSAAANLRWLQRSLRGVYRRWRSDPFGERPRPHELPLQVALVYAQMPEACASIDAAIDHLCRDEAASLCGDAATLAALCAPFTALTPPAAGAEPLAALTFSDAVRDAAVQARAVAGRQPAQLAVALSVGLALLRAAAEAMADDATAQMVLRQTIGFFRRQRQQALL